MNQPFLFLPFAFSCWFIVLYSRDRKGDDRFFPGVLQVRVAVRPPKDQFRSLGPRAEGFCGILLTKESDLPKVLLRIPQDALCGQGSGNRV